jgi:nucleotide-binding universal stress UspA family protein
VTVVVGYIPNEYGEAALETALAEARRRGLKLVVVNTSKGDALVDTKFASQDTLRELEGRFGDVEHEVRQTVGLDVAEELLKVADEVKAELLVIGMRHRTPVGKLLMGSVAQRVLLDAKVPVLAVKP